MNKTRENLGFFGWHLFCQHILEVPPGIEPGIEVLQTFALPLGQGTVPFYSFLQKHGHVNFYFRARFFGADYGARTRHLDLGKVALYQMS